MILLPPAGPAAATADLVVIEKAARRMTLHSGGAVLRAYDVALGRQPRGPKRREGDGRTPEGRYVIEARNSASKYHLALRISYPDADDRAREKPWLFRTYSGHSSAGESNRLYRTNLARGQ
ncbi:MAG: L,D-transpeptidase family protein, partial [Alphaproteobacteria bacterium]|nr:L,D-transpeptidase family protein [Alphaproteobacteria bacterium]